MWWRMLSDTGGGDNRTEEKVLFPNDPLTHLRTILLDKCYEKIEGIGVCTGLQITLDVLVSSKASAWLKACSALRLRQSVRAVWASCTMDFNSFHTAALLMTTGWQHTAHQVFLSIQNCESTSSLSLHEVVTALPLQTDRLWPLLSSCWSL